MDNPPTLLFTAFERSGDDHAAAVIRALKARRPELRVYGLGGEKMAAAGAEIIEETVGGAVMGIGALGQYRAHRARVKRLGVWLRDHPIAVHVPTDSPAANWAVCKLIKSRPWGTEEGGRVVHLVAPQLWAWASWRIRRLHKWSDRVLCVLPFEEEWFRERGVETRFIGHPLFDEPVDGGAIGEVVGRLGVEGEGTRIGLLPGSRPGEVMRNWPVMHAVFERLRQRHPGARGVVAAADEAGAQRIKAMGLGSLGGEAGEGGEGLRLEVGEVEGVLAWSEVVLTVSGTVTLRVARAKKPMVIIYKVGPWFWRLLGRWLIHTRTFTLPNLVALGGPTRDGAGHVLKEFVPWLGGDVGVIADEVSSLLDDEVKRTTQLKSLDEVVEKFEIGGPGDVGGAAAEEVLGMLEG